MAWWTVWFAALVYGNAATTVQGTLLTNTLWSPALGSIHVTSNVWVPAGVTLTVLPGTEVRLTNATSIRAVNGGIISIMGSAAAPVVLRPGSDATNSYWDEISAQGAGSSLSIRFAEIGFGQVTVFSNAVGQIEDSYLYGIILDALPVVQTRPTILSQYAGPVVIRRCVIRDYFELLLRFGVVRVEECLLESIWGDGIDFDGALPGSVVRNCTLRHGLLNGVDGCDIGSGCTNVLIEGCLTYDIPLDKGVSIGETSHGITVSNCLIYACDSGIAVKDQCTATIANCCIASCPVGINLKAKFIAVGGYATNTFNNILWSNTVQILATNNAIISVHHSDVQGTNWPGSGNLSLAPRFLNVAQRDYRVGTNSPCVGAASDGGTLGPSYPVGAAMAPSHPHVASIEQAGGAALVKFWVDSERTYSLLCSTNVSGGPWVKVTDAFPLPRPYLLTVTNSTAGGTNRFYRLVSPRVP